MADTGITLTLGRAGSRTTVNHTVYINGEKSSSRSKSETVTVEPQDTVILQGTDKKSGGEPGRHEGKEGRKPEALSFASPVAEGEIISNYGKGTACCISAWTTPQRPAIRCCPAREAPWSAP